MNLEKANAIIKMNFPSFEIKSTKEFDTYFVVELESKGSRMDLLHIVEKATGKILSYDPITLKELKIPERDEL